MKLKFSLAITVCIFFTLLFSGCMADLTPIEVSERFWTAVQNKDAGEIKKYISTKTIDKNDLTDNILPLEEISLGRTVIDADQAWVDTTVIIAGDDPFTLPFKTVLLKDKNQWKVDYDATVISISEDSAVARVMGSIADISGQFAKDLDRSLEEIQKAIPEVQKEIEIIEENVRHHLPELKQKVEEFMRQLEEALEGFNKRSESPGTTEI